MMAYLVMMAGRLAELRRVLKQTGSIYLHCDPTASHYLKLTMDAIFGFQGFLNEVVWRRSVPHNDPKKYGRTHDYILVYVRDRQRYVFHQQYISQSEAYIASHYTLRDEDGRIYRLQSLSASGPGPARRFGDKMITPPLGTHWRFSQEKIDDLLSKGLIVFTSKGQPNFNRYLDESKGSALHSIWTDIFPINPQARERLGYPTQKPEALLERIINVSSNEGDLILDPFCGCGTTVNVAERLHRRWIGVDITHLAITLIKNRLHDTFGSELSPYEVIGAPRDVASARALAQDTGKAARYQFEWWALSLVDARPAQDKKKGADTGVDGFIHFFDDESGTAKKIVVQVKSGHVTASQIRDLKAVVEREKAVIGAFITLEPPTKPMIQEALAAEFYQPERLSAADKVPKIQILTIADLLSGASLKYPRLGRGTFKRAQRKYKNEGPEQPGLPHVLMDEK